GDRRSLVGRQYLERADDAPAGQRPGEPGARRAGGRADAATEGALARVPGRVDGTRVEADAALGWMDRCAHRVVALARRGLQLPALDVSAKQSAAALRRRRRTGVRR